MGEGELQLPLRTTASLPPLSVACNIFDGNFELLMNIETAWIFVPGFHIKNQTNRELRSHSGSPTPVAGTQLLQPSVPLPPGVRISRRLDQEPEPGTEPR